MCFIQFQSTPGINAGRIVKDERSTASYAMFQSTPGINAGRIRKALYWKSTS